MPEIYRSASVVVGAGRVVLEALASGVPAVALGESSALGLLTEENFEQAFDSNFGDCGEWNLFLGKEGRLIEDFKRVLSDLALRKKLSQWGREIIIKKFDAEKITPEILKVYEEAAPTSLSCSSERNLLK
jgi:glycosyltransferase involved in cell wall biosynthesis